MEIIDNKEVKPPQKIPNTLDPSDAHKNSTLTDDNFTTESRKMIREGNYKKAFRFIDKYYTSSKKLGTVIKIKTCRRLLASISAICSRKFVKEIQKPENFLKVLENGNYYLEQWHQNIIHFAQKTNQKLNTAGLVLNDLSADSSLEDLPHSTSRAPGKNILNKRESQRKSHLLQILKIESGDRQSDQISDTSMNDFESSHKAAEDLMPEDLNSKQNQIL